MFCHTTGVILLAKRVSDRAGGTKRRVSLRCCAERAKASLHWRLFILMCARYWTRIIGYVKALESQEARSAESLSDVAPKADAKYISWIYILDVYINPKDNIQQQCKAIQSTLSLILSIFLF